MTLRERILFGASPQRLPFALRDLRALCCEARDRRPQGVFLLGMIKQCTKLVWPTETQMRCANAIFRELGLAESDCPTRDRVVPRKPTEPTPAEIRARDCAALAAMQAARPLKPPARAAVYETVPSEVLKLRAKDAHPDDFKTAFYQERLR